MSSDVLQQSSFERLQAVRLVSADSTHIRFEVDGHAIVVSAHTRDTLRVRIGASTLPDYGLLMQLELLATLALTERNGEWDIANGDTCNGDS